MDTIQKYINGTWIWLEEKRMDRAQGLIYLTPQTEKYSLKLMLNGGVATFFKNGMLEGKYKFQILKEKDITGFPDDEWSVIVFYEFDSGTQIWYVPVKICQSWLIMEYQYTTSVGGQQTWKKQ